MRISVKTSPWLIRSPRSGRYSGFLLAFALFWAPADGLAEEAAEAEVEAADVEADAGAPEPAMAAGDKIDAGSSRAWASCIEHLPRGATRPTLEETFPARGLSGYALPLTVTVTHGKGETVLPQGFRVQTGSDAARALTGAGFTLPDASGDGAPSKTTVLEEAHAKTTLTIPFLALPKEPGRKELILPPVPIAVARASGEIVTTCTQPHRIVIDDATASIPDAKPRRNPPPRSQIEEFTLAKQLALGSLVGATLAIFGAWLLRKWLARPKPIPPPPPPRPPWEVAIEELAAIRQASLAAQNLHAEHFDRVSDAVRKYLGDRFGFDGLESTTDEISTLLRRVQPQLLELGAVLHFLGECDLVKFAKVLPTDEECERILELGERIVWGTMPAAPAPLSAEAQKEGLA